MSESLRLLEEYYAVMEQIKILEQRKGELRQAIAQQIERSGAEQSITIGSTRVRASIRSSTVIDYDEEGLRLRLGERYRSVLEPDVKKIKQNLPDLRVALEPHLDTIGSVSRELVRQKTLAGEFSNDDFAGLFTKEEKNVLYVQMLPITP